MSHIESKLVGGTAVIYPGPYLNQLKGEEIERRCRDLLDRGVNRLVINFDRTELINSIGISILLGIIDAVESARGTLMLSNMSQTAIELFDVLGLTGNVRIEESEEAALARIRAANLLTA